MLKGINTANVRKELSSRANEHIDSENLFIPNLYWYEVFKRVLQEFGEEHAGRVGNYVTWHDRGSRQGNSYACSSHLQ